MESINAAPPNVLLNQVSPSRMFTMEFDSHEYVPSTRKNLLRPWSSDDAVGNKWMDEPVIDTN